MADRVDGTPIEDIFTAIYRWAEARGISDPGRLDEAIRVARWSYDGTAEPEVAIWEATDYLGSYLE